jgi:DNA-binding transcriptional ArsR family regulator
VNYILIITNLAIFLLVLNNLVFPDKLSYDFLEDAMGRAVRQSLVPENIDEMQAHASEAADLLKALANETRLLILCSLAKQEMSVGELNERVDISQSALSQHLAVLRRDALVKTRRDSQTIFYSLADGRSAKIIEVLHQLYCA